MTAYAIILVYCMASFSNAWRSALQAQKTQLQHRAYNPPTHTHTHPTDPALTYDQRSGMAISIARAAAMGLTAPLAAMYDNGFMAVSHWQ